MDGWKCCQVTLNTQRSCAVCLYILYSKLLIYNLDIHNLLDSTTCLACPRKARLTREAGDTRDKQTGSPWRAEPPIWQWHFSLVEQLPLRLTASDVKAILMKERSNSDLTQHNRYSTLVKGKTQSPEAAAGLLDLVFVLNQEWLCHCLVSCEWWQEV